MNKDEFLISLCFGTNEIPKKYSSLYEQIKSCGAVQHLGKHTTQNKNHAHKAQKLNFKLSSKFGIFRIHKIQSHIKPTYKPIFLQDITKTRDDIKLSNKNISKSLLDSLQQDDIVLALLAGKSIRIIKILSKEHSTNKNRLVYLEKQCGKIIGIDLKNGEICPLPFSQKSLESLPRFCVISYENHNKHSKPTINKILGVLQDPKVDEAITLFLGGRKEEFSAQSKELARSFGDKVEPSLYPSRIDLRGLDFITIDPSDAKDHDDAIYYDEKKRILYVAIADVSEYVLPQTSLDIEAKSRLFSLYFPHKCHPMLPQELSENLCSLKANEVKLAIVCEVHFPSKNAIKSSTNLSPKYCKIYEALITPKANLSYEYIDTLLDKLESSTTSTIHKSTKSNSADVILADVILPLKHISNPKWILSFCHIAQCLKEQRLKKGFDFFSKEQKMILDKNSELESICTIYPTRSHSLIEEAMLLANVCVAQILDSTLKSKGIYRVHNPPTKDRLSTLFSEICALGYELKKDAKTSYHSREQFHKQITHLQSQATDKTQREILDKLIIKAQKEAKYESKRSEHFGLGFDSYTHFTSPIRRYSDILAHRLLKLLLQIRGEIHFYPPLAPHNKSQDFKQHITKENIPANILKHINFTLESIVKSAPLLNEAERIIAKTEKQFKDRKYARVALKWQKDSHIWIRIIDERFPSIGIVESRQANYTKTDSIKAQSNYEISCNKSLQDLLQGARVFVLDSRLEKNAIYLASIAEVDIGSAKIYAKIFKNQNQTSKIPKPKTLAKPKQA